MESVNRQHDTNGLVEQIAQHLRNYPCDLRHARKLMRYFHASADDMARAIELIAPPVTLPIDPEHPGDKVFLHILRYPADMIDMCWVMRQLQASEADVQHALTKLADYIVDGGEDELRANLDKK